jgi:hypothetical protein
MGSQYVEYSPAAAESVSQKQEDGSDWWQLFPGQEWPVAANHRRGVTSGSQSQEGSDQWQPITGGE